MTNTKLQAARELIQEKRYAEARAVLKTIPNNPTAVAWLERLDEISSPKAARPSYLSAGMVLIALIVAALSLVYAFVSRSTIAELSAQATQIASVPTHTAIPTDLPTLTPLPTSTVDTHIATLEAGLSITQTALSSTQTALSAVPSPEPTDCGAKEWWNFAAGSAIDFMDTLAEADIVIKAADPDSQFADPYTFASSYADVLEAMRDDVAGRDYAICIKSGRDALVSALSEYRGYMLERALSISEYSSDFYSSEDVAQRLDSARELMREAARELENATGQDVSFLLEDGITE